MAVEPFMGTLAQRAFVLTVAIQAIIVLAMVGATFGFVNTETHGIDSGYRTLACFLALFGLGEIFELLMVVDALKARNVIQLAGIQLFHLALIIYAALQVHQTQDALLIGTDCDTNWDELTCPGPGSLWNKVRPFLIVAPIILSFSWCGMMWWITKLYYEFGWAIFHVVGANPRMKTMYQFYQIMICLLKFDFFFFTAVTMQLLIVVLDQSTAEFGVTIAAIPIVLILLALCGIAVQREIKSIMVISLTMMLAAESYFIYKLVRFFDKSNPAYHNYDTVRATLTTFTIVAFLLLFTTFGIGLRCFSDFDQGLRGSKTSGQSYTPLPLKMDPFDHAAANSGGPMGMQQRKSSYNAGGAMAAPRLSIE